MKKTNTRLWIFVATTLLGILLCIPSITGADFFAKVKLGLDLQGGLYTSLGVKTEEAVEAKIKTTALGFKYYAEKNDILIDSLKIEPSKFGFALIDKEAKAKLDEYFKQDKGLNVAYNGENIEVVLTAAEIVAVKELAVTQAVETIRNRLDLFGLAEPSVTKSGADNIIVELPGVKSQAEEQRARELIAKTAKLELMEVDEGRSDALNMGEHELKDASLRVLVDYKNPAQRYVVKDVPVLDGSMLTDAKVGYDNNGQAAIEFKLNSQGASMFGDFTAKSVGKRLAIVLDGKVYSAPSIKERIGGGSGQITGHFTPEEARDLAIALRSGALPASVILLEKRSVGPSLGADSIHASLMAFVTGGILVFGFMVAYYGAAGLFANIALISNIVLIVAVMAMFGATMTLPGMAGLVLTIGMSVDANVIINERIRELLRMGMPVKKAIEEGYNNAMSAIVDSNVTAVIAAVAMYVYGTGPIKGFAVVMAIGVLISMLTAIVGTHGLFDAFLSRIEKSRNIRFWFGMPNSYLKGDK
jgi:preprotein translocase subunit SecD